MKASMSKREALAGDDPKFRREVLDAMERLCDRDWRDLPTVKPRARKATRATLAERVAIGYLAELGDFGALARQCIDILGWPPPD